MAPLVRDLSDKFRSPDPIQSTVDCSPSRPPSIFNVIVGHLVVHQVAEHSKPGQGLSEIGALNSEE